MNQMTLKKQQVNLKSGEKMKALVIAHGYNSKEVLKREFKDADLIICSDGGAIYAMEIGIKPDIIIGDLDSIDKNVYEYFLENGIKIVSYPREKDFSDTELCVDYAIDSGADSICIISGIGSRIDHSLINISLLYKIKSKGVDAYIATDSAYIYICNDYLQIEGEIGDTLSLIPLTLEVKGITTKGLKYKLVDGNIRLGQSIGVSNEFIEKSCSIKVKEGILIVVKQKLI
ncbi:thiamine pyrophosphokinase [Caloramator proteoclasticus DSM 10124]|uniref:Thiamine diphosphokinase n=2 Tax=Clostridiaceae TaxID=31979 RepID=A0A1M5APF6_9CLOT|nr:thiamine pyrophosphokinase [Caloramator proteoclasticus DSM 10124]